MYKTIKIKNDEIICCNGKLILEYEYIKYDDANNKYKIKFLNGETEYIYTKENITILKYKKRSYKDNILEYYKNIAIAKDEMSKKEGIKDFYYTCMKKLMYFNEKSVLNSYLKKENKKREEFKEFLYPFGLNYSQMEAVRMSFENQISIIQGPPGTGKTQTILNIIANAISNNKTIAIVSPNNAATKNVYEKLKKYGYEFIVAELGNSENKKNFFDKIENMNNDICNYLEEWDMEEDEYEKAFENLKKYISKVSKLLENKNKIQKLKQELREWKQEEKYYKQYIEEEKSFEDKYNIKLKKLSIIPFNQSKQISFLVDITLDNFDKIDIEKRINYFLKYGIYNFKQLQSNEERLKIIDNIELNYYKDKIDSINKQIQEIDRFLYENDYDKIQNKIEYYSKKIFEYNLFKRYNKIQDRAFNKSNFIKNYDKFIKAFPVILSTSDAILDCIHWNKLFDYVVMDESSMASLLPGIFPMAVTKNIIIVGDEKQLSNITFDKKQLKDNISIGEEYDYFKQNVMSSLKSIFKENLPVKLLKEHYRCNPMIINFCNKEYYDDNLIIMTSNEKNEQPLVLIETSKGNHMKYDYDWKVFNQREIESFLSEEFIKNVPYIKNMNTVGFITPYRRQVEKAKDSVNQIYKEAQIDTVHKFQGKECEAIIFSTVLDNKASKKQLEFVENPLLVNVAISRAEKLFVLNTSSEKFINNNKSISNLIRYIKYYGDYSLSYKSEVRSIFDLLMKEFAEELIKKEATFRNKHSRFASENLMMDLIDTVLKEEKYKCYSCSPEYQIKKLQRDFSMLNKDEIKYLKNGARVDFAFYYKSGKEPVAILEVDGHKYHRYPKQKIKDDMKDNILKKLGIPFQRFSTNGSEEELKLRKFLDNLLLNFNNIRI